MDRAERLQRRQGFPGAENKDSESILPEALDPITLQPVLRPAMSPAGHVMGIATWVAVLAEHGCCPFTKQSLHKEQVV